MIIGISGLMNSGKDTCFQYIQQLLPDMKFERLSFATKVKDVCATLFDWDREMLEGLTADHRLQRNNPDAFWSEKMQKNFTPRLALQITGNEFKEIFCQDLWATIVEKQIIANPDKNYIITDLRYPDEIEMIERYGGYMFEIQRGELPDWYQIAKSWNQQPNPDARNLPDALQQIHPSEWRWIGRTNYIVIKNDGTLDQFKHRIQNVLVDQGLLQ